MLVRPGRLLPSVIVGALVTSALALGAGTAAAEEISLEACQASRGEVSANGLICTVGQIPYTIVTEDSTAPSGDDERDDGGSGNDSSSGPVGEEGGGGTVIVIPDVIPDEEPESETPDPTTQPSTGQNQGNVVNRGGRVSVVQAPPPAIVQRPSALPVPDVRGGVAPNLLSPALGAPGGLAAGAPRLGMGTLDPAMLLAPAGSPLRTLTGVDEGSPVTTASDVQAMAFDNLPGGLGTPAVTGTLILSAFAALALRHRVLRRARLAADADADTGSEDDTAEIPARQPVA